MNSTLILSICSFVLTVIGTWALFFLSQIKRAQVDTTTEIKEMNKDIRDILTKMARNDEKVIGLAQRIDVIHEEVQSISQRVFNLEKDNS